MDSQIADLTVNQLEQIVDRVGGYERALKLINHELQVVDIVLPWQEKDEIIYLPPLTSDGTTGPEWIKRLRDKKRWLDGNERRAFFLSEDFKPTSGVTYNIAIMKGQLFSDLQRNTKNIYDEAEKNSFSQLNPEAACLISDFLNDEEFQILNRMGIFSIEIMHKPFIVYSGEREIEHLFSVNCLFGYVDITVIDPRFCRGGWNKSSSFAFDTKLKLKV